MSTLQRHDPSSEGYGNEVESLALLQLPSGRNHSMLYSRARQDTSDVAKKQMPQEEDTPVVRRLCQGLVYTERVSTLRLVLE